MKHGGLEKVVTGLVIVAAVSACEGWGPRDTVTSPLNDPALLASISVPVLSTNGETIQSVPFIPFRCSSGTQFSGPLDIAMTAGDDVDLHKVTIQLGDPVVLDQPSSVVKSGNTFDSDDLARAFGSTQIRGGTVRTFRFRTDLSCSRVPEEFVSAIIQYRESSGQKNSLTVTAPFGSAIDSDFSVVPLF
jgi:hypothetical protein